MILFGQCQLWALFPSFLFICLLLVPKLPQTSARSRQIYHSMLCADPDLQESKTGFVLLSCFFDSDFDKNYATQRVASTKASIMRN